MSTDVLAGGWAKALGGDRKQFDMFIDKMLDGFAYHKIVVDKAGTPVDYVFLEVNHAFERMTGLKRSQIISKKVTDALVGIENDPADWIGVYGKVALTGEPVQFENYNEALGKWFKVVAYSPEKGYFVALFEDITERKKAVNGLKESEERFRAVQENSLDRFTILKPFFNDQGEIVDFTFVYQNVRAAKLTGRKPEELVGVRMTEVYPAFPQTSFFSMYKRAFETRQVIEFEDHYQADRVNDWFFVTVTPISDGIAITTQIITERKKAEEALKQSEQRYRQLFNSITDMFAAVDFNYFIMELIHDKSGKAVDGIYREVNLATERLIGKTRDQLIGKSRMELFGNVSDDFPERFDAVAKSGNATHFESYGAALKKYYDVYAWKVAGNQVGVILTDITDSKKAEDALKKQSSLVDLSPDAIIVKKIDDTITFWSQGAQSLYGWTKEEAVGQKSRVLLKTKFPDPYEEILSRLKRYGRWSGEKIHQTKSGRKIIVDSKWLATSDIQGKIDEILETNVDITERKKAEEALTRINEELEVRVQKRTQEVSSERQRLYNVLETLPAYVVLLDKDYRMPFANKVFRETFGESHGRRCHEYLFGRDSECEKCETYKVLKTNKPQHWEWTGPNKHDYEIYDYPFVETDGSILILEMGIDVTERKKAEQQALESARKLKDAERLAAIGATAGMVGHDIRNPLQAITGDLYLAKTELAALPENEQKINALESLEEIEYNIDYINKIVADLQDYARPLNPRAQETNIKMLFNEILAKNVIPKKIRVTVEVEDKAEKIMADHDYLKRIAANLILNAVQAMPEGGKLSIRAYSDKQTNDVLITVNDTGVGIPEDIKPKLFTPMMTTKSKGQGFGLAVVKRMTEGLGGTVTFESQEGKGTTFKVHLPQNK